MTKKGLLTVSCMAILALGAVIGIATAREHSASFLSNEVKSATRTGIYDQDHQGAHLAENAIYFVDEAGWYGNDGCQVAFYFFREEGLNKIEAWSDIAEQNWERSGHKVYESLVPAIPSNGFGFETWDKVIAVRIQAGKDVASWDNQVKADNQQSSDMTIGTAGNNAVFSSDGGYGITNYSISAITAVERLEVLSWAQNWSKPAGASDYCKHDGSTDTSTLATQWTASKNSFEALGEDVKYAFSTQVAEADAEEDNVAASVPDFAARYDWVFNKYSASLSLTNWADRTTL